MMKVKILSLLITLVPELLHHLLMRIISKSLLMAVLTRPTTTTSALTSPTLPRTAHMNHTQVSPSLFS